MSVKAKKHLGQHFLINTQIAEDIGNLLSTESYDSIVEIGPGMGVLSQFLILKKQELYLIDIDFESIKYLKNYFPSSNKTHILHQDFLKTDLSLLIKKPFAVIGNFPYNISSQILFKVLNHKNQIPEMIGMFQKEVAERVVAKHGNKTYGILSVLIQVYYNAEYCFTVSEKEFSPPPKVKSAVIRLKRNTTHLDFDDAWLFKIVKSAFSQRRKKLRNALKSILESENLEDSFFDLRAEQISVNQFVDLAKKTIKHKKTSEENPRRLNQNLNL